MAKKVYYGDMRLATMEDVQNYVASVIATLNLAPLDYITAGVDGLTRMDLSTGQFSMMLGGVEGSGVFDIQSSVFTIGWAGNRALQLGGSRVQIDSTENILLNAAGQMQLGAGSMDINSARAGLLFGFVDPTAEIGSARLFVNDWSDSATGTLMATLDMTAGVSSTINLQRTNNGQGGSIILGPTTAVMGVVSNANPSGSRYTITAAEGHQWTASGKKALAAGLSSLSPVIDTDTSVFGNFSGAGGELPAWINCITGDANGIRRIKVSGTFTLSSSQVGWDKPIISLVNDQTLAIGGYVGPNGPASGFGIQTFETVILGGNIMVAAGTNASYTETSVDSLAWAQSIWSGSIDPDLVSGSIKHQTRYGTGAYAFMSMYSQQLEDGNTNTGVAYLKMGVDGVRNNASTNQPNTSASHFEQVMNLQTGSPVFAINQTGYNSSGNNYLLRAFLEGSSAAGTEVGTLYGNISGGSGGELPAWSSCISGDASGITSMMTAENFSMLVRQPDGSQTTAMRVEHTGVFVGDSQSMTYVNGQGIAIISGSQWPNRRGLVFDQGNQGILTFIDSNHGSEPTGAAFAQYLCNNGLSIGQTGQYIFGKAFVSDDIQGGQPSFQNYVLVAGQTAASPVPTMTGAVYGMSGGGGSLPEWVANVHGDATGINWIRTADKFVLGNIDNTGDRRRLFMLDGTSDDKGITMYVDGGGLMVSGSGHAFDIVPTTYDGRKMTGQYTFMSAEVQLDKSVPDVSAVFTLATGQFVMCAAYGYQQTSDFPSPIGGLSTALVNGTSGTLPAWINCIRGTSAGVSSILVQDNFALGNFNASGSNRRMFTMTSDNGDISMFVGTSGNNGEFLQLTRNGLNGPTMAVVDGTLTVTASSTSTSITKQTGQFALSANASDASSSYPTFVGSVGGNFANVGTGGSGTLPIWAQCIFGNETGISYMRISDRFIMSNGSRGIMLGNDLNNGDGVYIWDGSAVATLQDVSYSKQGTGVFYLSEGCSVSVAEPPETTASGSFVLSTGMPAFMAGIMPTFMFTYTGSVEGNIAGGGSGGSSAGTPFIESDSYGITTLRLSKNGFRMGMVDPNYPSNGTVVPVIEMTNSMGISRMLVTSQFILGMNLGGTNYGTYADVLAANNISSDFINVVVGGNRVSGVAVLSDGDWKASGNGSWRSETGSPYDAMGYMNSNNLTTGTGMSLTSDNTVNILAKSGDINLTATTGKINLSPANGVYSTSDVHVQS